MTRWNLSLLFAWQAISLIGLAGEPTRHTFHHEHVLGTSLEIQVVAEQESTAAAAEANILTEIERLSGIFSTYTPDSEFSRWQRSIDETPISAELFEVLSASERWQTRSHGAFQPGVELLSRLWRDAQQRRQFPATDDLPAVVKSVNQPHWRLNAATRSAQRLSDCPLTLNAIAKGWIVERACRAATQDNEVRGLIINLGGDLRVFGESVQEITVADPLNDAENAPPIDRIFVTNRAVATSGNYRRGFSIAGQRYSHIIDPRTGKPVEDVISATVVADSSADADALATICNVLPVEESLALVASVPRAQCLMVAKDGRRFASAGWSDLTNPRLFRFASLPAQALASSAAVFAQNEASNEKPADAKPKAKPELQELVVKFELDRPKGSQYRRPYVAVWLEDEDEFPVKTAVLWMQTKQPGPRWHRDLLRWYRNDGVRKLADGTNLIGTVSAATRGPGEYKAVFDGLDDAGQPLKPGKYTLYIEAAREHGTYQIIRHPLTLGKDLLPETKLKGNVEVKAASVEYRPQSEPSADKHGN